MDDLFEVIELPISFEQFLALPTNPAFKYEYFDGRAYLSPRPKCYHAVLDLAPREASEEVNAWGDEPLRLRPLGDDDWEAFPELFAHAFWRVQPFSALDDARRLEASRRCLDKTRGGGDGPLMPEACWVAVNPRSGRTLAATLVTMHRTQDDDEDAAGPGSPLPEYPHLTWIFVAPLLARHGVGSALLSTTIRSLLRAGHTRLESTFLLGNESSTLWHWRNGFRLLGYGISPRRFARPRNRAEDADPMGLA